MLKHQLLHPEISAVLARAGHHAKVLIADGNYPSSTARGPQSTLVSLNLCPGVVTVAQVFQTLLTAVPVDEVCTMGIPPDDPYALQGEPPVWAEYRTILRAAGMSLPLKPISKWDFYEAVASREHVLTIQTGDRALWANLLLSLGCRTD
uniref:Transporter n=1 Tax=Schlesneria paludicola TaxID=360056 RepID=A0A7C4LL87_9PLAN